MRQQEQRLAARAVAAEPRDHAAAARRPARGPRVRGRPRAARRRCGWAASSSGPGGSGGLIDGIRIRSRRKSTSSSCAPAHAARRCRPTAQRHDGGPAAPSRRDVGGGDREDRLDDPEREPDDHDRDDHRRPAAGRTAARRASVLARSGSLPPAMYGAGGRACARARCGARRTGRGPGGRARWGSGRGHGPMMPHAAPSSGAPRPITRGCPRGRTIGPMTADRAA